MKNKSKLSLLMALLMIVSTLSVGTVYADDGCGDQTNPVPEPEELDVVKQVWNDTHWDDSIYADIQDIVSFKITITYHETTDPNAAYLKDIYITDTLPTCLAYVIDSATVNGDALEPDMDGKILYWNLTGASYYLKDGESHVVEFDAEVVDYGVNVNNVFVEATETCSGIPFEGCAEATVTVEEIPCVQEIQLEKKVWNETSQEWEEYIEDLHIGDLITFKIDVTYIMECEEYPLYNLFVEDELPCCLEFNETIDVTSTGQIDPYDEIVSLDKKEVIWDWTDNNGVRLVNGDMITIIFTADFVNYCQGVGENWAHVKAWGCKGPNAEGYVYEAEDNANVDCTPELPKFEKLVWKDQREWVDEIETSEGSILTFGLRLDYNGDSYFTNIKFVDQLPCILEYVKNSSTMTHITDEITTNTEVEPEISADGKTLWWNLTETMLYDNEILIITFDALVTGTTCDCPDPECKNYTENWASVETGCPGEYFYAEDTVKIRSGCNCAPYPLGINGSATGKTDVELEFSTTIHDDDGDQVYYMVDFNDGTPLEWHGLFNSDETIIIKHTFTAVGTYNLKVKAKDIHGKESLWVGTHTVTITVNDEPTGLKIDIPKKFNLKTVTATIKNLEGNPVSDVQWNFTIYKAKGIGMFQNKTEGIISEIAGGATKQIQSGEITLKFGMADIEINAVENGNSYKAEGKALILGRIVLVTKISMV